MRFSNFLITIARRPPMQKCLLAPTGALGVTFFVRSSGSSLSRAVNLHLSSSNLQAISQQSVSSQSAVSQQSVSSQSAVSQQSVSHHLSVSQSVKHHTVGAYNTSSCCLRYGFVCVMRNGVSLVRSGSTPIPDSHN